MNKTLFAFILLLNTTTLDARPSACSDPRPVHLAQFPIRMLENQNYEEFLARSPSHIDQKTKLRLRVLRRNDHMVVQFKYLAELSFWYPIFRIKVAVTRPTGELLFEKEVDFSKDCESPFGRELGAGQEFDALKVSYDVLPDESKANKFNDLWFEVRVWAGVF